MITPIPVQESVDHFRKTFDKLRTEISKFIVGQKDIIDQVLTSVICGGHVLLEGVPGLGKTALVSTLSKTLALKFQRIQFTPDLLPADIVGTQILVERESRKVFEFQPGPVFCNVLLADGSVRFLSASMDIITLVGLGSRDGGEVVQVP